jgi:CsoR family transcriptional regulator, copper-sensing transcriptional repressor
MDYEFRDGKLLISRTDEERAPIVQRLRRIEGQVRGLIQMVEANRYCLDEVQQANAVTAATREVALLILTSHLEAGVQYAVQTGKVDEAAAEVTSVLRSALRFTG